jgi:hypothetical protein
MTSNTRRLSIVVLAVVAMMAIASTAMGAKPDKPDKPGNGGGGEHPPGQTCAVGSPDNAFAFTDGFTIDFDSKNGGSACVDWTTTAETAWQVTVTGNVRSTYFNIRDSHPGDFCWLGEGIDVITGQIPVATLDACGTEYTDDADSLVFTFSYGGKGPVTLTVQPAP